MKKLKLIEHTHCNFFFLLLKGHKIVLVNCYVSISANSQELCFVHQELVAQRSEKRTWEVLVWGTTKGLLKYKITRFWCDFLVYILPHFQGVKWNYIISCSGHDTDCNSLYFFLLEPDLLLVFSLKHTHLTGNINLPHLASHLKEKRSKFQLTVTWVLPKGIWPMYSSP